VERYLPVDQGTPLLRGPCLAVRYSEALQNDGVPFSHRVFIACRALTAVALTVQANPAYLVHSLDCLDDGLLVRPDDLDGPPLRLGKCLSPLGKSERKEPLAEYVVRSKPFYHYHPPGIAVIKV